MKQVDSHPIKVTDTVTLLIYSSSAPMYEITEADALEHCESRWQLQEGKEYDYEISRLYDEYEQNMLCEELEYEVDEEINRLYEDLGY